MGFEFRLPDVGEGVVEGEIVKWKVAEGEIIKLDQPMVEVMTDKATVEIPAPRAGKVARIMVPEGKICAVGQVMIVIDEGAGVATAAPPPASVPAPTPAAAGKNGAHHGGNGATAKPVAAPSAAPTAVTIAGSVAATTHRVLATPATRKIARELGVDLAAIEPTGKDGRATSDDVKSWKAKPAAVAPQPAHHAVHHTEVHAKDERIPFRGMRKAIAANLSRSKQTAAHFTYVEEVDMTDLVALRNRAKARAAERGVKLSYLPFIIKAAVHGLKKWPSINSTLDEGAQEIVRRKVYHLGVATQGPQGLSVGVVRDADRRSIFDLAREIERIAEAIRNGKATREDLTGSTFTISSLGQLGGVLATPIINFPEAAIMGVHKISERPAVVGGQIVIRQLMNLSISVDHRIADGYDGAMFLQEVKTYLEDPTLMFMEMV